MSKESKRLVTENIAEVYCRKNYIIISADRIERNIYFIKTGIARTFAKIGDQEITFAFGKEGDTVASLNSFIANQKGYEYIELLEDSVLYELNSKCLQGLFNESIEIANWGRRFAENELIKTEKRLISRQSGTASERYEELLIKFPDYQKGSIGAYCLLFRY